MARLRVREPDTLTRVTEYVPEIVSFVERIIKNGYGYEADGSVYFATQTFDATDGHDYPKLEPWNKYNKYKLEGGEGEPYNQTKSIPQQRMATHHLPSKVHYLPREAADPTRILLCGKPQKSESLPGLRPGVPDGLDGTLNVLSWLVQFWATTWIFIPEVST